MKLIDASVHLSREELLALMSAMNWIINDDPRNPSEIPYYHTLKDLHETFWHLVDCDSVASIFGHRGE